MAPKNQNVSSIKKILSGTFLIIVLVLNSAEGLFGTKELKSKIKNPVDGSNIVVDWSMLYCEATGMHLPMVSVRVSNFVVTGRDVIVDILTCVPVETYFDPKLKYYLLSRDGRYISHELMCHMDNSKTHDGIKKNTLLCDSKNRTPIVKTTSIADGYNFFLSAHDPGSKVDPKKPVKTFIVTKSEDAGRLNFPEAAFESGLIYYITGSTVPTDQLGIPVSFESFKKGANTAKFYEDPPELDSHMFEAWKHHEPSTTPKTCHKCKRPLSGAIGELQCKKCKSAFHSGCAKECKSQCVYDIFTTELEVLYVAEHSKNPSFVVRLCVEAINNYLDAEGIHRQSCSESNVKKLRGYLQMRKDKAVLSHVTDDVHVISRVLKQYLRGLPKQLISPSDLHIILNHTDVKKFMACDPWLSSQDIPALPKASCTNPFLKMKAIEAIQKHLKTLPRSYQINLECVLSNLYRVKENPVNQMDTGAIFTCFHVCIFGDFTIGHDKATSDELAWRKEVMKILIEDFKDVYPVSSYLNQ